MIIPLKEYFVINDTQYEFATSIIFVGVGFGSFMMSYFVDKLGRVNVLKISVAWLLFFQLLSIIWYNIVLFSIFRFLLGISLGILPPITMNILCEYLPIKHRSYILTAIWSIFVFGNILTLIVMLIYMPDLNSNGTESVFISQLVISVIVSVIFFILVKDSPRNLILNGKEEEALKIIEEMHQLNPSIARPKNEEIIKFIQNGSNIQFREHSLKSLFTADTLNTTVKLIIIWIMNSMISYGPMLIFSRTLEVLKVSQDKDIISSMLILNSLSMAGLITIPILSEFKFMGLIRLIIIVFAVSLGLCVLFLIFKSVFFWVFIFSSILNYVSFNLCCSYSNTLYPTKIRDTAIGFLYGCTRAGGFISQFLFLGLFNIGWIVPYYILAVLILVSMICAILLKHEPSFEAIDKELIRD